MKMITATSLCGKGVALVFVAGELVFVLVIKAKGLAEGSTGLDECLAEGGERSADCLHRKGSPERSFHHGVFRPNPRKISIRN